MMGMSEQNLVFQTAFPGDVFLSIPLLKRMRVWTPEADLVLACRPGLGEFFLRHGLVDRVIEIDKKSRDGRNAALRELRATQWEWIVCPHQSPRTAGWVWSLRARAGKIGFRSWWNFPMFTHRVVRPDEYPDALRQLSLLAPVDKTVAELFAEDDFSRLKSPRSKRSPWSFAVPAVPDWASMQVVRPHSDGKTVFLAPGSVWATKRWTASGYEGLARLLISRGARVVLVGAKDEAALCGEIAARVEGCENRAGTTSLSGLVDLLATGVALVCNDSGAMHAAAACGLPTVAVFGPTTLELGFRPWNTRSVVVQRDLSCRPCGKHGAKKCPIGTHECMTQISAEDVYSALGELMRT